MAGQRKRPLTRRTAPIRRTRLSRRPRRCLSSRRKSKTEIIMSRKTLLTLSVSVTLATISLAPTAVFAQFPGPPPMGPGGPQPIAAGGPPAFASPPPMGPGGAAHAGLGGPAPPLGAGAGPRGDLRALGGVRAGGRDGPAVARSVQARSASVRYSRSGSFSHGYGGRRYGYGAAYAAEPMLAMPMAARTMAPTPITTATT